MCLIGLDAHARTTLAVGRTAARMLARFLAGGKHYIVVDCVFADDKEGFRRPALRVECASKRKATMSAHWWWWGLAVVLAAAELMTGTLYLLVLALGLAIGGLAAFAGAPVVGQVLTASVTALVGWVLLRRFQPRRNGPAVQANRDVLLDIGSHVRVEHWQSGGVTRVRYRGASWDAVIAPGAIGQPAPGEHEILAIEGNRLVLAPVH